MGAPEVEIEGCLRAHRRLLEDIDGLTDDQARCPSLLPDWSVGHVLTHLARNADSFSRRLEGAARGEVVDQYPGGYARRASDIAAGAGRPATELVADVEESAYRLEAIFVGLPPEAWDHPTRDVSGAERPARALPFRRWREVVVHHSDLGLGYTVDQWPDGLVSRWLPQELERLPRRTEAAALLAWAIGRAPAPDLSEW